MHMRLYQTAQSPHQTPRPLQPALLCTAGGLSSNGEPAGSSPAAVVSGSEDHHIYIWGINGSHQGQAPLLGLLHGRPGPESEGGGHCDVVLAVSTHPTEPIIASGAHEKDRTIKIWRHETATL